MLHGCDENSVKKICETGFAFVGKTDSGCFGQGKVFFSSSNIFICFIYFHLFYILFYILYFIFYILYFIFYILYFIFAMMQTKKIGMYFTTSFLYGLNYSKVNSKGERTFLICLFVPWNTYPVTEQPYEIVGGTKYKCTILWLHFVSHLYP